MTPSRPVRSSAYRLAAVAGAAVGCLITTRLWGGASGTGPTESRMLIASMSLAAGLLPESEGESIGVAGLRYQLAVLACIMKAVVSMLAATAIVSLITEQALMLSPGFLCATVAASAIATFGFRRAVATLSRAASPTPHFMIYGANDAGIAVALEIQLADAKLVIDGFIDERTGRAPNTPLPYPNLGSIHDVFPTPTGKVIDGIIIVVPGVGGERLRDLRRKLRGHAGVLFLAPDLGVLSCDDMCVAMIESIPVIQMGTSAMANSARMTKRFLDVVVAAVALSILAPVLLVSALAIKLESPGPVFFRQRRFGRNDKLFDCYKLRSMQVLANPSGEIELTQRRDPRVTRVGAILRRTSLDEIPQFINVLQGHMSVVGPRPHPPGVKAGTRRYEEVVGALSDRYSVKPGITGLAQVTGLRGNTFTEEHLQNRFRRDIEYIRNWSVELDIWIILKTIVNGFGGRNAF